jgi:hypothetical protein
MDLIVVDVDELEQELVLIIVIDDSEYKDIDEDEIDECIIVALNLV